MGESIPPEPKSEPPATRGELEEPVTLPPPADVGKLEADADPSRSAGAGPSEVSKTIRELSRGLSAATRANEQLTSELRSLRELLDSAHERERTLTDHGRHLDDERAVVAAQQDEFLAALLEEHEEARARAAKIERERDELRAEASRLRARLGTHRSRSNPPPPTAGRPTAGASLALELDPDELSATLRARSSGPPPPPVAAHPSPLPLLLDAASSRTASIFPRESTRPGVGGPKPCETPPSFGPSPSDFPLPAAAIATERPPRPVSAASLPVDSVGAMPILKRKPDPATRPLVDYSLGEGGVRSETLEGVRISPKSSKPPQK
jgi:hypothetical protein